MNASESDMLGLVIGAVGVVRSVCVFWNLMLQGHDCVAIPGQTYRMECQRVSSIGGLCIVGRQ